ncbi:MAG: class I SAM-dependent methyltransferase [Saprospiraceae bacterium]|nr:class I SAM-dependent methyltransferase [Pyrinomonadaceae bacterium]
MNKSNLRLFNRSVRKIKNILNPVIDISDEYTSLLCGINAGWLERGNLYSLNYAIEHLPSGSPIIEIGSFCGLSTNLIGYYKEKHGVTNKLINCDKWEWNNSGPMGNSRISIADYLIYAQNTYMGNVQTFSGNDLPHTIKEFSDDFFRMWRAGEEVEDIFGRKTKLGGPISFAFVDGNHEYEFAKNDFLHTDEFLESGGFLLFDDSADGTEWEVSRVRDEVIATKRYEIIIKNPNYLFRKH